MSWEHEFDYEYEQQFDHGPEGDPRRCRRHPHIATSSADGLHDVPCRQCEYEAEQGEDEQIPVPFTEGEAFQIPFNPTDSAAPHTRWERRSDPNPCGKP